MPEQQGQTPRPGEQLMLERDEVAVAVTESTEGGAGAISPVIILPPVIIAVVMSFCLAAVYGVTKEPIAEAKKADKREKLSAVMPAYDNDPLDLEQALSDVSPGKAGNVMLYTGTADETVTGYGITSAVGTGYSGYFSVVFGLDTEGRVKAVRILETMETPGLGSKAAEPDFINQFIDQDLGSFNFAVSKDGGDIDAVTGATITSRAVTEAVRQGLELYEQQDDTPAPTADAVEEPDGWSGGWQRREVASNG